jgi:hypothetical protein
MKDIAKIAGEQWKMLPEEVKTKYSKEAQTATY